MNLDDAPVARAGRERGMNVIRIIGMAAVALLSTTMAFAQSQDSHNAMAGMSGDIAIESAWTRATPPNAQVAGGFLAINNRGTADDRLLGGSSPVAERIEVHEMTMDGDVMKMRPLQDGLTVPAGGSVELKPGGYHLMMTGLKQPLKQGETIDVALEFAHAGTVGVTFSVEAMGAKAMSGQMPGMHGSMKN